MKKERLVLLPGYDGNGKKTFAKLRKLLEKQYQVITIDYPYFSNPEKQYGLDELVEYVDGYISDKAILLGFSMGGFVASRYAFLHPEKTNKLVLVSSSTVPTLDKNLENILGWANKLLQNRLLAWGLTKLFLASNLKNFPLPKPGKGFDPKMGYAVFGSLAKVMTEAKLENIRVDKLAILFEDDKSFPAEIYRPKLSKQGFATKILKTGGHAEKPDYWEKVAKGLLR